MKTADTADGLPILSYDSPEYRAHSGLIGKLNNRALELQVMSVQEEREIIGTDGIVCDGPDDTTSVRTLFERAHGIVEGHQPEYFQTHENPRIAAIRTLLHDLLATKFSMEEFKNGFRHGKKTEEHVQDRSRKIAALHQHCRDTGLPSPLVSMFRAEELEGLLASPDFKLSQPADRGEVYQRLSELFACNDSRLPDVLIPFVRYGKHERALDTVDHVVALRHQTFDQFFRRHPKIASTYAIESFAIKSHESVLRAGDAVGIQGVIRKDMFAEKYLRSLMEAERMDDALRLIQTLPRILEKDLQKAVAIAGVQLGWWLYANNRFAEGIALLEKYLAYEIADGGRRDARELYNALRHPGKETNRVKNLKAAVNGKAKK